MQMQLCHMLLLLMMHVGTQHTQATPPGVPVHRLAVHASGAHYYTGLQCVFTYGAGALRQNLQCNAASLVRVVDMLDDSNDSIMQSSHRDKYAFCRRKLCWVSTQQSYQHW